MQGTQEILINVTPHETRVALLDTGILQELHLERAAIAGAAESGTRSLVGHIYRGKVTRVLAGMQAAFIDLGLQKKGFLHVDDVRVDRKNDGVGRTNDCDTAAPERIEVLLHEGQTVWVQVVKDSMGDKGARLSMRLSLTSRNLVYLPLGNNIGISQKINNPQTRKALSTLLQDHVTQRAIKGGFIIRTQAKLASEADFLSDVTYLLKCWQGVQGKMLSANTLTEVYQEPNLAIRALRDLAGASTDTIRIDAGDMADQVVGFCREYLPEFDNKIQTWTESTELFDLHSVEQQLASALERKVLMQNGAHLIFDQTEAMTTIDVNTGSYVGKAHQAETILNTNLEAAVAIAHQLRLRRLAGIIVVDFIDMKSVDHQNKVLGALKLALAEDSTRSDVTQISSLGLVEIKRPRTQQSLQQVLCETCPTCAGQGVIKSGKTVCYEILREITREHQQFKARHYTVLAGPSVVDLLSTKQAANLARLQEDLSCPITLQVDRHCPPQHYEIALG